MGVEEGGGSMCIGWDGKMLSVDVGGLIAKFSAIRCIDKSCDVCEMVMLRI